MNEIEHISERLYEKLRNRFEKLTIADENGMMMEEPAEAVFFTFQYDVPDSNLQANVSISIAEKDSLKVFYNDTITDEVHGADKRKWYDFLRELRQFAKRNTMTFDPHNITRPNMTVKDFQHLVHNNSSEDTMSAEINEAQLGKATGSSKSSYQKLGDARIVARHKGRINAESRGARSRNISSLFIENSSGERFKLPFENMTGARAMVRHVSNGGMISDDLGSHICEMVKEMSELRNFMKSCRGTQHMDEDAENIMGNITDRYAGVKRTLESLKGQRGYSTFAETYQPTEHQELGEDDVNNLREKFTRHTFDENLEGMLETIAGSLAKMVKEAGADPEEDEAEGLRFVKNQPKDIAKNNQSRQSGRAELKQLAGNSGQELQLRPNPEEDADIRSQVEFAKSKQGPDVVRGVVARIIDSIAKRATDDGISLAISDLDVDNPEDYRIASALSAKFMKNQVQHVGEHKEVREHEVTQFDHSLDHLAEGTWELPRKPMQMHLLADLMSEELPVGLDATNATGELNGIIGDDELFDDLGELFDDKGADADARNVIWKHLHRFVSHEDMVAHGIPATADDAETERDEAFNKQTDDSSLEPEFGDDTFGDEDEFSQIDHEYDDDTGMDAVDDFEPEKEVFDDIAFDLGESTESTQDAPMDHLRKLSGL